MADTAEPQPEAEGEKPTIHYGPAGEVISEPNVDARVAMETAQELAELDRSIHPELDEAEGGVLTRDQRRMMQLGMRKDCCEFSSEECKTLLEELGGGFAEYAESECCTRKAVAVGAYMYDRRSRGKSDVPAAV